MLSEPQILTGPEWLFDLLVTLTEEERVRVLMIIWRNWQGRNDMVHGKKDAPIEASCIFLQSYVNSLEQVAVADERDIVKGKAVVGATVKKQVRTTVKETGVNCWPRPPSGWLSVSVDGSYDMSDKVAGVAAVIRDSAGDFVLASCCYYDHCGDAFEVELLALRDGIQIALTYTAQPLLFQTD